MNQASDYDRFYKDITVDKEYDYGIPDKNEMVVIDIGSHLGIFANYIQPKSKIIYAIEASNENYTKLLDNIKLKDKIIPFHLAVCDNNEMRDLYMRASDGDNSLVYGSETTEKVQGITLADFIKTHVKEDIIDLLKIDIEGGETLVFKASDFKYVSDRIKNIIGELHGCTLKDPLTSLGFNYEEHPGHFKAWK